MEKMIRVLDRLMKSTWCTLLGALCIALLTGIPTTAQEAENPSHAPDLVSPYSGQEDREIKTLSEEDIRELQNGGGWGLAKAAELNGFPGPAHLLEMRDQGIIDLSEEQLDRIRGLHREMKARAVPLGLKLIEQERELNRRFDAGDITDEDLRNLVSCIAETMAELRYVHLATHLQTMPVLTQRQIQTYNRVRGYTAGEADSAEGGAHSHQMHLHE